MKASKKLAGVVIDKQIPSNASGTIKHRPKNLISFSDVKPDGGVKQTHPIFAKSVHYREKKLAESLIAEIEANTNDVKALCDEYGLKREQLGRLTGFSVRALAEWAADKMPSAPAQRRLRELRRLLDALSEIVKKEAISKWLHLRHPMFDNMTPIQVIEVGEIDRLWALIYEVSSGVLE